MFPKSWKFKVLSRRTTLLQGSITNWLTDNLRSCQHCLSIPYMKKIENVTLRLWGRIYWIFWPILKLTLILFIEHVQNAPLVPFSTFLSCLSRVLRWAHSDTSNFFMAQRACMQRFNVDTPWLPFIVRMRQSWGPKRIILKLCPPQAWGILSH